MNCLMCKGDLEDKKTTYMVELKNWIIIIKNVPSQVCKQCGEVSYSNEVAQQLERLVNSHPILFPKAILVKLSETPPILVEEAEIIFLSPISP